MVQKLGLVTTTIQLGYDSSNRRTSLTLADGVVVSYGYDNASELTGLTYTLNSNMLGNLTYAYDMAGRRTGVGGSYARTGLPSAQATTGYDAANELTTWGTATPTYDSDGNLLGDGTNSYVWNARNKLASMNMSAQSFQYDPFGRRVSKTILTATTNYLYDGVNPVEELSGVTPTANLLTGGVDEYFQRTDSVGAASFLADALGATIALTNSVGSNIAQYTYDPFGSTGVVGSSTSTYEYTGRENDGTGLYFFRERYYNSTLQRFISEDPAGLAGGINSYTYVGDGPSNFTDPLGLAPMPGRGGCKLLVVRDCFDPSNGVRRIDYKLVTDAGDNPQGKYYVTEQLTNLELAAPWGQSQGGAPNSFDDVVGPLDPYGKGNDSTLQYFLVSPDPNSLDQAFWVPIEVPGVGDFMVQGIWWQQDGNIADTSIFVNGRRSPSNCGPHSLF